MVVANRLASRRSCPGKMQVFRASLQKWYRHNGRKFPWRYPSATTYRLVVSELLLQRTRAETVATFYYKFEAQYPSWNRLARAKTKELELFLKPVGLWKRRAATLVALAKQLKARQGRFPRQRELIEALPGVGQYIANAILLLVHGQPEPLLDVNMARVLERYFGPRKLVDIRYDPYLQELARKVVQGPNPKITNWAILDLAATVCRRRLPLCDSCPLQSGCRYGKTR